MIRGDGKIYCWGNNTDGELGVDPSMTTTQPSLADATAAATSLYPLVVTAGAHHSCAVDTSGVAKCWGLNSSGQLGDGSTTSTHVPVTFDVDGEHVRSISAGESFTCALTTNGSVWCSGLNGNGQLGDGTTDTSHEPVPVRLNESAFLSSVTQIVTGNFHACALVTGTAATDAGPAVLGGRVFCWGRDFANGTNSQSTVAVEVAGLDDAMNPDLVVRAIAAGGNKSCAVMSDGTARCWGYAVDDSLGDGNEDTTTATPVTVTMAATGDAGVRTLDNVVSIGLGLEHACAVRADGGLWCWGANTHGQQANGSSGSTVTTRATLVGSLSPAMAALGGNDHACALTQDGVYCWGADNVGQLGNGSTTTSTQTSPVSVPMPDNMTFIPGPPPNQLPGTTIYTASTFQRGRTLDVGGNHACMVVPAGSHVNEGNVATDAGAVAVDASTGTRVACWGANGDYQLGGGTTTEQWRPRFVTTDLSGTPVAVATGASHSCALTATGTVYCWGNNASKQAAQDTGPVHTPALVSGVSNAVAITAGDSHTCALLANGEVQCWGWGYHNQLGGWSGSNWQTPQTVQVRISGTGQIPMYGGTLVLGTLGHVVAITAGGAHTCALQASGRVLCWGFNHRGQSGRTGAVDGLEADYVIGARPVLVSGGSELSPTMVSITAGNNHTCAVAFNGDSYCWGSDHRRQINASGGTTESTDFVRVATSQISRQPDVLGLSAGGDSTCALHRSASSGSAYIQVSCWGANDDQQVGIEVTSPADHIVSVPSAVTVEPSGYDLGDTQARVAVGSRFACALSVTGDVHCWGANDHGQLGRGTSTSSEFRADQVLDLH